MGMCEDGNCPECQAARKNESKDFREFHDDIRKLRRRGWIRSRGGTPYVRPTTGTEIKGKLAIKAAKRERVKAMKAAQVNL